MKQLIKFSVLSILVLGTCFAFAGRTPKVVFNTETQILSFYCDESDHAGANNKVFKIGDYGHRSWQGVNTATQAVVDVSFCYYRPRTVAAWFSEMTKLQEIIGLENIDTSQAVSVYDTFRNTHVIKSIDISAWNFMNVKNFNGTFRSLSVRTIYVSPDFAAPQCCVTNNFPFSYTWALVGGEGTKWEGGMESIDYAKVDCGALDPGMFTRKVPEYPPFIRRVALECFGEDSATFVIDGFRLSCGTITVEVRKNGQVVASNTMSDFGEVTFVCLEPSTTYQLFVRAENSYGKAENNDFKFTTPAAAPSES